MQEKQHQASEQQRKKFADRGEIARSQDLVRLAVLVGGVFALLAAASMTRTAMVALTRNHLGDLAQSLGGNVLIHSVGAYAKATAAPLLGALVMGLFVGLLQTRFQVSKEAMQPKFSRLNPLSGLKRMFFSAESLVNMLLSTAKVGILGAVCAYSIHRSIDSLLTSKASLTATGSIAFEVIWAVLWRALLTMLVLAIIDYAINRFKLEKKMKMSTQEVKEEQKEQIGDPQIRAKRKRKHRELVESRSVKHVPTADVVIVNPTHYAVALRYNTTKEKAPRVVAKGVDKVAERIREVARKNGIPVVSQPPLTRLIYAKVKVGKTIPADFFNAVAAVLAYVYRKRGGKA